MDVFQIGLVPNRTCEIAYRAAIDNLEWILKEAGGTLQDVVMLRIYLVESVRGDQGPVGRVLRERFRVDPPASSWIIVRRLSEPEWLVEIEAEAVLDSLSK